MSKTVSQMSLEEKRERYKAWRKDYPERAAALAVCELFGFKGGLGQWDSVRVTRCPPELQKAHPYMSERAE